MYEKCVIERIEFRRCCGGGDDDGSRSPRAAEADNGDDDNDDGVVVERGSSSRSNASVPAPLQSLALFLPVVVNVFVEVIDDDRPPKPR